MKIEQERLFHFGVWRNNKMYNEAWVNLCKTDFDVDFTYDVFCHEREGRVWNGKPIGMWFSKLDSNPYICEWQRFLAEGGQVLIPDYCREDGNTNAVFAVLNRSLTVKPKEIKDEISKVMSEFDENAPFDETRKRLLELVRKKYNREDIDFLICNLDDNGRFIGFDKLFSFFIKTEEVELLEQEAKNSAVLSKIDHASFLKDRFTNENDCDKEKIIRDVFLKSIDLMEYANSKSSFSDEEYIEMMRKYMPILKNYILARIFLEGNRNEIEVDYIRKNYLSLEERGYGIYHENYDVDGIANDGNIGKEFQIVCAKAIIAELKSGIKIEKEIYDDIREVVNEAMTREDYAIGMTQKFPGRKINTCYDTYKRTVKCFSGIYTEYGYDLESLCVFDLRCLKILAQHDLKLFSKDDLKKAIELNRNILKGYREKIVARTNPNVQSSSRNAQGDMEEINE